MSKNQIEVIVRGVCVKDGCLLLCHSKGRRNTYLPGGHVDPGESAIDALKREMREEAGIESRVGKFLGCVEHVFTQDGSKHYELNLLFKFDAYGLKPQSPPPAREDWIEFLWAPISQLRHKRLEPSPLCRLLPAMIAKEGAVVVWGSTYRRRR